MCMINEMNNRIKELERANEALTTENEHLLFSNRYNIDMYNQAKDGLDAALAHIERFKSIDVNDKDLSINLWAVQDSRTTVSLAEIKAQAIEEFQAHFDREYDGRDLGQFIEKYAEQVREGKE